MSPGKSFVEWQFSVGVHSLMRCMTTSLRLKLSRQALLGFAAPLLIGMGLLASPCNAQVTFTGVQTTVPASGLNDPYGVAVDRAGDIFVADTYNNRVVEMPAGGGPQTTVPASGLNNPFGVAVAQAGDVFIADFENSRVVEIPAGGGPQTTVGSRLSHPYGVMLDGAGDLFIADTFNNRVVEVPAGGGQQTTVATSELNNPHGVAVDGAGDVFIADTGNNRVVEIPTGGDPQTTVGSELNQPYGVAVDRAGDVFIADTQNSRVVKMPAGGGPQTTVGSRLSHPFGVAVDGAGDVFIADTGNRRVVEVQTVSVNFGSVNIGSSVTLTLNYYVEGSETLGTPSVLTEGASNLDFTLASGSTCTGSVTGGSSCTINVTFTPKFAGARNGAVQIVDNSGNVLATTYIHGIGVGPQIAFGPGVQTTVPASGLNQPFGVAMDGANDLFIADAFNNRVVEVTPGGVQTTVASGLGQPMGVAVDGAGDLFIADTNNNSVVEVTPGGVETTVVSGLNQPLSVAVDGAGDLFIADTNNNRVVEVTPGGVQTMVPASGLNSPFGVAVDGAGDVFIADTNNNRVVEVTPGGVQTTVPASGLNSPYGVAVDGAGDLFIADTFNSRVVELTSSGVQTTLLASVFSSGVAVDGAGDVFIADKVNSRVVELNRSTPPTLTFAPTNVGSTSSDSPQSVEIESIGNAMLSAIPPGLTIGPNFEQVAGSGTPADCTSSFSLTPGASCNLSISFTPTGRSYQERGHVDGQRAEWNPATQTITLKGTGIAIANFTITSIPPAEVVYRERLGGVILKLQSLHGFNANVTLSCSGGPAGTKCADLPGTVHVNGTVYAISGVLFPKNTPDGTYMITFTGVSGSLSHSTTAKFTVK